MENLKQGLKLLHEVAGLAAVNKSTHVDCGKSFKSLMSFLNSIEAVTPKDKK